MTPLDPASLKAVIFDLDDTLLKTRQTRYAALKYAGKQFFHQDVTDEELTRHWGKPFREYIEAVFGPIDDWDAANTHYKSLLSQFPNQAYEDAIEAVSLLGQRYALGVLSSASRYLIEHDLFQSGFSPTTFSFIQGAEDTTTHKPDPAVFTPFLRQLKAAQIAPNQVLYTGDSLSDYQAASGAGLHFIGIGDRTTPMQVFAEQNIPAVKNLQELVRLIIK